MHMRACIRRRPNHNHPPLNQPHFRTPNSANPQVKAFYQQLKWVPREAIHSLRAPCCVVHGETDGIIPLYQVRWRLDVGVGVFSYLCVYMCVSIGTPDDPETQPTKNHQKSRRRQARALAANLARAHLYVLRQTGHQVRLFAVLLCCVVLCWPRPNQCLTANLPNHPISPHPQHPHR